MRATFLPFARPDVGADELAEVREVLESGWLTTGPKAARFESEFAARVGAPHAVAVASGTAALHLALVALGVGRDDVVLTTPYTFAATAEAVRYLDARPLFVDVEPDTLNLSPAALDDAAARARRVHGARLRAVIAVHLAGHPGATAWRWSRTPRTPSRPPTGGARSAPPRPRWPASRSTRRRRSPPGRAA